MVKKKKRRPKENLLVRIQDSFFTHRSLYIIAAILLAVIIVAAAGIKYVYDHYTVTNIYVTGNTRYSNDEIIDRVLQGRLSHNSLYLNFKYSNKSIKDIPFIEKIDVDIMSPDTIRINVYEKAVAGYMAYLGRYIYFDRDGIVVESSLEPSDQVPEEVVLK